MLMRKVHKMFDDVVNYLCMLCKAGNKRSQVPCGLGMSVHLLETFQLVLFLPQDRAWLTAHSLAICVHLKTLGLHTVVGW